jgi:RNA-directed DNA polymerase
LLSNVALSVLDEYIDQAPGGPRATPYQRAKRRRNGLSNYRLIRYADDWCLAVSGSRADAEAMCEEIAVVLSTMGLRLSREKTLITHIEDGLDFLGWRIQRHRKRGTSKHLVYLYPAKKALRSVMAKVKKLCWQDVNLSLGTLLHQLNRCCGVGPPTSSTVRRRRLSTTYGPTPGSRYLDGFAASIDEPIGRNSAARTPATDGGPPPAR